MQDEGGLHSSVTISLLNAAQKNHCGIIEYQTFIIVQSCLLTFQLHTPLQSDKQGVSSHHENMLYSFSSTPSNYVLKPLPA